jgi:glutaredoxin 3
MARQVVVYSTEWCPDCKRGKEWLRKHGIDFASRDVETDPAAAQQLTERNLRGVPVVEVDGRFFKEFRGGKDVPSDELKQALGVPP